MTCLGCGRTLRSADWLAIWLPLDVNVFRSFLARGWHDVRANASNHYSPGCPSRRALRRFLAIITTPGPIMRTSAASSTGSKNE